MKQQKEFYVIATDNNNRFLAEYKNNDRALTFNAKTTDDIRFALIFEKEDEETTESIKNIAKAVGGRMVKVEAEYEITEEDGSELQEPVESNEGSDHDAIDCFIKKMLGM